MSNATYYDTVKAKIKVIGDGRYVWTMIDDNGQTLAGGMEFKFHHAIDAAMQAVTGLRLWSNFSKGTHTPNSNGSRSFYFKRRDY